MTIQNSAAITSLDELMSKYKFKTSDACCFLEIDGICFGWSEIPADTDHACIITVSMSDMDGDVEIIDSDECVYSLSLGVHCADVLGYMISETPITDDILIEW